jgi:zinc/manganese transport system substrate-binding protein
MLGLAGSVALVTLVAVGCATTPSARSGSAGVLAVVAVENFWGSLAAQLGGTHVRVTNIIENPDVDPHIHELTVTDGKEIAAARLVIINGVGYDTWASTFVRANPSSDRSTLTVGDVVGARDGDNPHRWYNPDDVRRVIDAITADLQVLDPANSQFYGMQKTAVLSTNLRDYFGAIDAIRVSYGGTPVGASESIFAMLSPALGLKLVTPPTFLTAVTEGAEPTARDKATIDNQINTQQIKVYVYNSQNRTPDVDAQVDEAEEAGIPIATITETLTPATASFQGWQVAQLTRLRAALARATGR